MPTRFGTWFEINDENNHIMICAERIREQPEWIRLSMHEINGENDIGTVFSKEQAIYIASALLKAFDAEPVKVYDPM